MLIRSSPESQTSIVEKSGIKNDSSKPTELFAETEVPLPEGFFNLCNSGRVICKLAMEIKFSVSFDVDDYYLNHEDYPALQKFRGSCSNILANRLHTDVSIVASNGSTVECHKCYLATYVVAFFWSF